MNVAVKTGVGRAAKDDYKLSIGGKFRSADKTFEVCNPATNAVIAHAPDASRADLDDAVAAAKAVLPMWSRLSWEKRGDYVTRYAEAIEARKDELADILTLEQGKPRYTMAVAEIDMALFWMKEMAKQRLLPEVIEDTAEHVVELRYTPVGVVGAITPWNFPVILGLWKIAPCLITGNTMVLKPSPFTPLCTLWFGAIAQEILPPGVLNVVSGGNDLGQWMTEHPDIAKITFTGSTATGKKVMSSSAVNLKRVTLELGGNDAAIVLEDANIDEIVPKLFWAAFNNSGQWCVAVKRLYVHSSIHREFVDKFVAFAKDKKVGDGMDPTTDLGPIQNKMQFSKLKSLIDDIRANGYKVALGGTIDESLAGNFVPITIVDNPPENSRVVKEEPFGPVLPIVAFNDVDDVVARANDTPFGLGGSVWGTDRKRAKEVADRLDTGTVWVNEIHIHGVTIPFGGHKQSGIGVENGVEGLREFTNTRTMMFHK